MQPNNNLSIKTFSPIFSPTSHTPQRKIKILVWSDCVLATTGFGTVSRHILKSLQNTGRYDIDQLAINYFGDFYDKNRCPYTIVPAKLGDPGDPYGNQMVLNSLQKKDYDIVFIINDTFVVERVAQKIDEIRELKKAQGRTPFKIVYYYPIDCCLLEQASTMIKVADRAVAYTKFAKKETLKVPNCEPTDIIYHGTDCKVYHPLSKSEKLKYRARYFNVKDPDTFLIINVSRNSVRKDIAKTILAFSEFKKQVPNSVLYLHAVPQDGVGGHITDLYIAIKELGLEVGKDVIFPQNYSAASGFPDMILNRIYNCANASISTNLGEGWGLTLTESMAAGIPMITGNHTTAPEILGPCSERGYLYQCKEKVYVDNSGYRKSGRLEDIVKQIVECHKDWKAQNKKHKQVIKEARKFTEKYSWDNVCNEWVRLFKQVETEPFRQGSIKGEML